MQPAIYNNLTRVSQSSVRDWLTLMKPGILFLVFFSGLTGLLLANGGLHPLLQAVVVVAIGMGSAAGAMYNMVYDQDIDSIMKRTQHRPLVSGVISATDALFIAHLLAIGSVALIGLASNWPAAMLLAFSIFFYAVIYTVWLKRHTPQNIVIGGAAGAFPPVIGWLAVTGEILTPLPWLLFLTIFLWTPPHFWALAVYRHDDYKRAKVPMLPITAGIRSTKQQMILYTLLLACVTQLIPVIDDRFSVSSHVSIALLNCVFIWHALRVCRHDDGKLAMKMFGYSILYLFLLFSALLLDVFFLGSIG